MADVRIFNEISETITGYNKLWGKDDSNTVEQLDLFIDTYHDFIETRIGTINKDNINNIEEDMYAMAEKLSIVICFPFFKHCKHSPCNYKTSKYVY